MFELIIVGGGPAGISAGIYASRQKIKTLLIAKDFQGQIGKKPVDVENFLGFPKLSGIELAKKFEDHLKLYDIETLSDEVNDIKKKEEEFLVKTLSGKEFSSKTVIIATGAVPKKLGIPGEEEFVGKGVSYCAICDGIFFKDSIVTVIGGGNAGFETAIYMKDIAKKVYIIEYSDKLLAEEILQDRVNSIDNVEIMTSTSIKEIKGEKEVSSIIYENLKTGDKKELEAEGVFIQIGLSPASEMVKDLVNLNNNKEIIIDPLTNESNIEGLLAAGDVSSSKFKQLIISAGSGATAALSAFNKINKI
jgi:thioredoxin-disulfide reductase